MSNARKVFVPFNINDEVRVKLTDYGRRVLRARHMELYGGHPKYTPKERGRRRVVQVAAMGFARFIRRMLCEGL